MTEKLKKVGAKVVGALGAFGAAVASTMTAFAEPATSLGDAMGSAVQQGASDASSSIVSMLGNVAPIIIGIVVGVIVLTAGIAWIKKIRSNSK